MSFDLNGTNQYGVMSDSSSLDLNGNGFTINIWARMKSASGIYFLISKQNSYQVFLQDGRLTLYIFNPGFQDAAVSFPNRETDTTKMFMWTVIYNNSTGVVAFYVNQTFKGSDTFTTGSITDSGNNIGVCVENDTPSSPANIEIASLRIYDKPIFFSQLQQLFMSKNKTIVDQDRDLVTNLRFAGDEPGETLSTIEDRTENGNDCTMYNSPDFADDIVSLIA